MAATVTPPRLAGLTAVSKPDKNTLGFITWFSVPDESVSLRKLRRQWVIAGLDPKPLPKDPKAINVFKRAMREQEGRHEANGQVIETDVRQVSENEDECVYQISRVVRDLKEREIDYPKAMRVIFVKRTGDVKFNVLGGVPRSELVPVMTEINDFIENNGRQITGPGMRGLIRQYIKDTDDEQEGKVGLSGENLRGRAGGVYFVMAKHKESLESLAELLSHIYDDGRGYLHAVPMADTKTERELIRRHHVANTLEEMKDAMREAADLIREDRSRGVRSNVQSHHWNRLQRLRRRAAEYNRLLDEEHDEVEQAAEMLSRQLRALVSA